MAKKKPTREQAEDVIHPYFYKYRSLSGNDLSYVIQTLTSSTIKFSTPLEFNDPYDCHPVFEATGSDDEWIAYGNQVIDRLPSPISDAERASRVARLSTPAARVEFASNLTKNLPLQMKKVGVYCMSLVPDSMLMWAHYANSHQGVCLRFKANVPDPMFSSAQRVVYKKQRPRINPIHDRQTWTGVVKTTFRKADYWSYEKEWRIVDISGPGVKTFDSAILDGIILGARLRQADWEAVAPVIRARENPLRVMKAVPCPQSFRLFIKDFDVSSDTVSGC